MGQRWIAVAAMGTVVGACELVAGIGDRSEATGEGGNPSGGGGSTSSDGGTGGATGGGSAAGGGTGGGVGGGQGGSAGGLTCDPDLTGGWPDSTPWCSDDTPGPGCPLHDGPEDGDLTFQAQDYRDCGEGIVYDAVTGLFWAAEPVDPVAPDLTWISAMQACTDHVAGPFDDWRLPSLRELTTLLDYGVGQPAIVSTFSVGAVGIFHWSSDEQSVNTHWGVNFSEGAVSWYQDNNTIGQRNARCVRGPHLDPSAQVVDTTIQDQSTGLEWTTADSGLVDWSGAFTHCNAGDGWRLPTIKELLTLFSVSQFTPGAFDYWSSTPEWGTTAVWTVDFDPTILPGMAKRTSFTNATTTVALCVRPIP